jgi:hypothetical protein
VGSTPTLASKFQKVMKKSFTIDLNEHVMDQISSRNMNGISFLKSAIALYVFITTELEKRPNLDLAIVDENDKIIKIIEVPTQV